MNHILITGAHGFLGRYVVEHCQRSGWQVDLLGRSGTADIVADLSVGPPKLPPKLYKWVIHIAGKAHMIPADDTERNEFFVVNTSGTKALVEALDKLQALPDALVYISTVAVYGCESGRDLSEDTPRAASDPYGLSKRIAEDIIFEWGAKRGVRIGIVRLPLIAGRGAPGNLGAMINAIAKRRYFGVGKGEARRSIVNAFEVAAALPSVATVGGVFHLTDGVHPSFIEIEAAIAKRLRQSPPPRIPLRIGRLGAYCGDIVQRLGGRTVPFNTRVLRKMTTTLTFDDSRARQLLGWSPTPVLDVIDEWCSVPLT